MKKAILLLIALAPVVSTSAQATVPTTAMQTFTLAFAPGTSTSSSNLPGGGVQPVPLDCNYILDKALDDLASGAKQLGEVSSTILVGQQAYAEASSAIEATGGSGFADFGGEAKLSSGKIKGLSHVAVPGQKTRSDLAFTIAMVDGKSKINWTHKGKAYVGNLDNCTSGYWTASASTSSIAIKMDVKVPAPPPE
jgi:hypothetical protein